MSLCQVTVSFNYHRFYQQVVEFLIPHTKIWQNEVLHGFPQTLKFYPTEWITELRDLTDKQLWEVDSKQSFTSLSNVDLRNIFSQIININQQLPSCSPPTPTYSDRSFFKVKGKKRHEIEKITPILDDLHQQYHYSSLIDIGGGQGHLARIVSSFHQLTGNSIDCCQEFQATGKRKLHKYPQYKDGKLIKYTHHTFGENLTADAQLFPPNSLTVGLHTCGPLALRHFEAFSASQAKTIINFGCCYLRMNPQTDTNLSQHVQQSPHLKLNKFALTLATRSHAHMTFEQFQLKQRVKLYRNIFHLLLQKKFNITKFISVGDSPPRHYWGSFFNYCQEKFSFIGLKSTLSHSEIEDFYQQKEHQELALNMFCADIIRWQFGRPLEIYILLDRLFWLQEQDIKAELFQLFDENLSPRNIAIVATK